MKVACTLLPYIEFMYGVTPFEGVMAHNRIAPRSGMLRSCRAERKRGGSQPEPSERRAITGLYKHTLF